MAMTGWNLPPGCNVSDIPGNRPEDERPWDPHAPYWTDDGMSLRDLCGDQEPDMYAVYLRGSIDDAEWVSLHPTAEEANRVRDLLNTPYAECDCDQSDPRAMCSMCGEPSNAYFEAMAKEERRYRECEEA